MLARNLSVFFLVVFWLATAFWVYKDARRRIEDPWLVAMATLLGLVPPFLGPIIYLFFRPPEYLDDVRERELEIRAMEERLIRRDLHCPVCRAQVEATFLVCPVCTTRLKQACASCATPLEALWQICPYCATPVRRRRCAGIDDTICRRARDRATDASEPGRRRVDSARRWPWRPHSCSSSRTACSRGLAGEIVARFERRGFELRGARLLKIPRRSRSEHYAEHKGKPFFGELVAFITSGPVLALAVRGEVGDRDGADDDGRDEPARRGARHDPRRLRARAVREHRARLGLEGERRSASSSCSSPTACSSPWAS